MNSLEHTDPRGEYKRVCPYCLEPFIANHMSRFYCESKNGIKNYCKNRQKRLVKELKERGISIDRPKRPPMKLIFEQNDKSYKNVDLSIKNSYIKRNIKILNLILNDSISIVVKEEVLKNQGFIFEMHDKIIDNFHGSKSPIYGEIMLVWDTDEDIRISRINL